MIRRIISAIGIACIVISSIVVLPKNVNAKDAWPTSKVSLVAKSAILIDASTGAILYSKKADTQRYPASITKIMTALLTIEKGNLNDTLTYSKHSLECIHDGAANIGTVVGEKMGVKDTLYAMMLQSGNECATALGEYVAGDEKKFANMMTQRAIQAGATHTNFVNANGLHNKNHYVTAHDMAFIMRDALKYPTFRDVINTQAYTIPVNNKRKKRFFAYQRHKMVYPNTQFYYEGIIGGKTGFTDQARNTLVTAASRNGMTLISVVLRSDTAHVYTDTAALLDYGFKHFKSVPVKSFSPTLQNNGGILISPFWDSENENGHLTLAEDSTVVIPKSVDIKDLKKTVTLNPEKNVYANITYNYNKHFVGTASVVFEKQTNTETAKATVPVASKEAVSSDSTPKETKQLAKKEKKSKSSALKAVKKLVSHPAFYIILGILIVVIIIGRLLVIRKKKLDAIREEKRNRYRH